MTYYTYAHSAPAGKIFYIGKGHGDRAYSFSDRSHDWKRAVKKHNGVEIKILANWNTEEEAFDHEKLLVECFKDMNYQLVNKTNGGKGCFGAIVSEEVKKKKSLQMRGYKYKTVTCPKCQKSGGEPTMKRWHFDKCTGNRPFKARVTKNGKRYYLGYFESKQAVQSAIDSFLKI
jgi:hypothetical protein